MRSLLPITAAMLIGVLAPATMASEASIKTPSPVIHLKDNLDEADGLGWCIDTVGRGYAETLHAHSCKPQGGDVQFAFDSDNGAIRSVEFPEKCVSVLPDDADVDFGLSDCDAANSAQRFTFDTATGVIAPIDAAEHCMVVGESSRSAGPFMSRDLVLEPCSANASTHRTWVIRD